MSRLQEENKKIREMWKYGIGYLNFLLWGIARGKTDIVGPTMHTISLVKVLVGYSLQAVSPFGQGSGTRGKLSISGTAPLTKTLAGISTSVHIHVIHRMWTPYHHHDRLPKGSNVDDTDSALFKDRQEPLVFRCCQVYEYVDIG